eukprot:TRINITY_DN18642_c0_g2_i1.p1 TRINITY_DN18642_c0_g2~~TRINITY_DN18642_c0_g2_i1.p1  ORF type:complete len:629 (+),score=61.69 TRINITY_DN18642_c0_g2_i1:285-1889(+)
MRFYPHLATAIRAARATQTVDGCVVKAFMNGDFLSPCVVTSLDGGEAMLKGLNMVGFDYACLGNHEFDLGSQALGEKLKGAAPSIINSNVTTEDVSYLPRFATFLVGERTVAVGGFLTEDPSIYSPSRAPSIQPINEAIPLVWDSIKKSTGSTPDLFLPMTHQVTPEDKKTGKMIGTHDELKCRTPVLLAGHDHEVYIDEAGPTTVLKVGMDAVNIGVCDIWWTADGTLRRRFALLAAEDYPPEPNVEAFVRKTDDFVSSVMGTPIANLPTAMSSKNVRFEASDLATFLLSLLKQGLKRDGVELVLLTGGAIRAGKDYHSGDFVLGDLYNELAFDTSQAIVRLPGRIIAESILNSRSAEKPNPGFLHCDGDATIGADHKLTHVDGKPFCASKMYTVSIYQFLLCGLNNIEPLHSYAKENLVVPDLESCPQAKNVVIEHCMKQAWRDLLGVSGLCAQDQTDSSTSRDPLKEGLRKAFAKLDANGDGVIDADELRRHIKSTTGATPSAALLSRMMDTLDVNKDGRLDVAEFIALAS